MTRQTRKKPRSAPAVGASKHAVDTNPQPALSDAQNAALPLGNVASLIPFDWIQFAMLQGANDHLREENQRLRQRLNALDALVAYFQPLLRDEDGYKA